MNLKFPKKKKKINKYKLYKYIKGTLFFKCKIHMQNLE